MPIRRFALLALAFAAFLPAAGAGGLAEMDREVADLATRLRPSVVKVHSERVLPLGGRRRTTVSGVVLDDRGTIATLGSAVLRAEKVIVEVGGEHRAARVLGVDVRTNVGILETDPAGLVPVEPTSPGEVRVGRFAMVVGNPFGLTGSVGTGIVSGLNREVEGVAMVEGRARTVLFYDLVQTTAPINPGDSGGLLADSKGRMIGMVSSTFGRAPSVERIRQMIREFLQTVDLDQVEAYIEALNLPEETRRVVQLFLEGARQLQRRAGRSGDEPAGFDGTPGSEPLASFGAQSINFVLPADQVLHVARMIRRFGEVVRLGIRVKVPDPILVAQLGLGPNEGLVVQSVVPGSAAARAGIARYDVLLSLGGRPLCEPKDVHRVLVAAPVDEPLEAVLLHRGERVRRTLLFSD